MSRCSFFVSAPTVRFLKSMEQVSRLSAAERRKIAADLYTEIKPLVGALHVEEMVRAADTLQDERWRLVYRGISRLTDHRFATVYIAEQWLRGRVQQLRHVSPVSEVLAE